MPGKPGQFDVTVDGQVVATKDPVSFLQQLFGNKGIPEEGSVIEALRRRVT